MKYYSANARAVFMIACGAVLIDPAVGQQATLGEDVGGWDSPMPPGHYATPDAACRASYKYFIGDSNTRNPYMPPVATDNPTTVQCKWGMFQDGCWGSAFGCAVPGPVQTYFSCNNGSKPIGNNRCGPAREIVPSEAACLRDDNTPAPTVGDPILLLDGANLRSSIDFQTADGRFVIQRLYRSFPATVGLSAYIPPIAGAAQDWRFGFEVELHLKSDGSAATLHLPDGTAYDFTRSGSSFSSTAGSNPQTRYALAFVGTPPADWSTLINSPSNWTVTDRKTTQVWALQTFKYVRNNDPITYRRARPLSVVKAGYKQTYSYNASGVLQTIADSYGRTFGFKWNYYSYPTNDAQNNFSYQDVPASIASITLPGGNVLKYTYNPVRDSTGHSPLLSDMQLIRWELDNPSGALIDLKTYQYQNPLYPDLITSVTDARGVVRVSFMYDGRGRAILVQEAGASAAETFTYVSPPADPPNELVRTFTNTLGKVAEFRWAHPANVNMTQLTSIVGKASANCSASASAYTYDANGFVASETDAENRVTAYTRDSRGRSTSITRGAGTPQAVTTTISWDTIYDVATRIVQPGLTMTQIVDSTSGLITQRTLTDTSTQTVPYSTSGQTRTVSYGYDATGHLTSITGPMSGVSTNYTYDPAGFLKTITNELGKVTNVTAANALGQPTSLTDPNGIKTALSYDAHGWLTGVSVDTANTSATTTIAYNAVGDVTSITNPIGGSQTFAYDDARRLTTVTDSAGEVATYTRDAMGNATSITLKNTAPSTTYAKTRTFDELGRLIKEVGAVAATSTYRFGYDRTDNLTSIKDPRSNVFSNGFDGLNRLISQTDEDNATVNLTRDGIDAITAYKDPRNLTTTYVRNGFGEIIQEVSPDKGTTTYVRDARGLVTQRTDGRGIVTNYTYDNAGRLTGKSYPSATQSYASFTWDQNDGVNMGIGRLSGISDESGVDWRVFNGKGYVSAYYRTPTPLTSSLTSYYSYDAAGNVIGVNYPSGRFIGYQRDGLGRITNIVTYQTPTSPTGQTIASAILYDPYGGVSSLTHGNGLIETFATDTDARITKVRVTPPGGTPATVDLALTWMGDSVTAITDNQNPNANFSQAFTYTRARRLATATGPYGANAAQASLAWTYDAVGNRTSETFNGSLSTYNYPTTSNRLTSIAPGAGPARSFTYDAAGDILTDGRMGLGLTYQYDVEGRLAKAYQTNAPANGATYAYDARGRLSTRVVTRTTAPTSTTTFYVYDLSDHLIAEADGTGRTLKEYIWLGDMPVAVVEGANTSSPSIYYVHVDHLKRPIRMTAQDWGWVWDVDYAPFGGTSYIYTNPAVMNGRFPGQWFQLETGLHDNWHRHYDPTTGRYLQPDPLIVDDGEASVAGIPAGTLPGGSDGNAPALAAGWKTDADFMRAYTSARAMFPDGPSLYGYAGQSPVNWVDRNGLSSRFHSAIPSNSGQCSYAQYDPFCRLHKEDVLRLAAGPHFWVPG